MPLFGKSNDKGVNYKSRLEHKLYLARENPDPVFDLSDCDLKNVPSGVYSLCKVFRKESLLLQKNNLTSLSGGGSLEDLSLLTVLDLRSNNFNVLTSDIHRLTNLKELYLNNNFLKGLPESISQLRQLKILSCSFNKLKKLPENLWLLDNLEELYLQGNPALCILPDSLSKTPCLVKLVLDIGRYIHPPDYVVLEGTTAVMRFLAAQIGFDYKGPILPDDSNKGCPQISHEKEIDLVQLRDQELQECKLQEVLAFEKSIQEQKDYEIKMRNSMKIGQTKLMEDLMVQQSKIAEEVLRFQSKKDAERSKLVAELKKVEESADEVINQMLILNQTLREPSRILQQQEMDRLALERIFSENNEQLRRKEVLSAMESLLAEERMQRERIYEHELMKAEVVKSTLSREMEWDEEISALLTSREAHQNEVASALVADEREQVAAVATLLERQDLESQLLRTQLGIVERELAALTQAELTKSRVTNAQLQVDLSEKRVALSNLLIDLLAQQQERKRHLLQTLKRMEQHRHMWGEDGDQDYWLKQYQRLLDTMPEGLFNARHSLDPRLIQLMITYGVVHYLPFLANCQCLNELDHHQLTEAGVEREEVRAAILKAISCFLQEVESRGPSAPPSDSPELEPSAPPLSPTSPSLPEVPEAQSYQLTAEPECIVCMNARSEMVFVPCGHLCCCISCSGRLVDCPLCRTPIDKKVHVIPIS